MRIGTLLLLGAMATAAMLDQQGTHAGFEEFHTRSIDFRREGGRADRRQHRHAGGKSATVSDYDPGHVRRLGERAGGL